MTVTLKPQINVGKKIGEIYLTKDMKALETTKGEVVGTSPYGYIVEFYLGFKKYRRVYAKEMLVKCDS